MASYILTSLRLCACRRAFTLVEMVLALALLTVLAAIAVPRFAEATARYQAQAAARRVAADLALARSEARLTSSSRAVIFENRLYRMPGVVGPDRRAGEYLVNLEAAPYRVHSISAQLGGDDRLVFDPFGAPDSAATVTVRVGRWTRTVTVEAQTGRVGVQ